MPYTHLISGLVLLFPSLVMAATICPPCAKPTHTFNFWQLLATPFSSPLCVVIATGFLMLLISPKTRNIALACITTFRDIRAEIRDMTACISQGFGELIVSITETLYPSHNTTYTQEDVNRIHENYKAKLEAKDTKIEQLEDKCNIAYERRDASIQKAAMLTQANIHIEERLLKSERRLKEALSTSDAVEMTALELDIALRDDDIKTLTTERDYLSLSLRNANAKVESATSIWQKLSGDYQNLKAAHAHDITKLQQQMHTTITQMQENINKLLIEAGPRMQAIDVLCRLSEGHGESLTLATTFAKVLQGSRVNLGALGIDEKRVDVLWEFVSAGQRDDGWLQPQRVVKGFKLA